MPKIESDSNNMDEGVVSPIWLTEALEQSRDYALFNEPQEGTVETQFQNRCREAAGVAYSLAQLRRERERIGFVPLSLNAYIQGLVKMTDVSLTPIRKWLGLDELTQIGASSALGLARLAQGLGIQLREALIHLRIGFAEQIDGAPMPLLIARHRSITGGRNSLEECERVLTKVESGYDLDRLKELRRAEFEFRSRYKERIGL